MLRTMLFSKIHRATITEANVDYVGSVSIDADLLELSGMVENEQVHIADLDNGERLITYVITAPAGSGTIGLNGAAALKMLVGHKIIIFSYGLVEEEKIQTWEPRLVFVDSQNKPVDALCKETHGVTF